MPSPAIIVAPVLRKLGAAPALLRSDVNAALDALPRAAKVTVAELTPEVDVWNRGPLAVLTKGAVLDPRVRVVKVKTIYKKEGEAIKKYRFVGIWPMSVDAMQLDWEATNQIQTFLIGAHRVLLPRQ